ncbi:VOC family protein [Virgibacillus halodenitrificans]|uniref:VOC family protein n=1 Tax=Virgibacillus halodenitrificans TaxID=1482 RepID=UPI0002E9B180|nr:VOC family protein [Virgibacillus halodenitrificans]MEC2158132.1 VOC family protein [Virgibacillus halodenitrificans]
MEKEGKIISADLTVENAEQVRDFYKKVIGWENSEVNMGNYSDYMMTTKEGTPVAGICHQSGSNAGLPPVWLTYFQVKDLDHSLKMCRELGGKVLRKPEGSGCGSFAVIEYPEGAVCALSQI